MINHKNYKKHVLGSKAVFHIKKLLKYSNVIKKNRDIINFDEGNTFTFLPNNINEENLLEFEKTILLSKQKKIVHTKGLKFVSITNNLDVLCQYIYEFLNHNKDHVAIFESIEGNSIFASHEDSFEKIIEIIKDWYVPGAKGFLVHIQKKLSSETDLIERVSDLDVIFVEAYDLEGFVIWENKKDYINNYR